MSGRVPFVGPSYDVTRKKSDVQRSINLYPVQNEVQGGKSVAYLDSIPGLTLFSAAPTPPPPLVRVNCDLLVHFDDTNPALWEDYSIHEHPLTLVPGSGVIAHTASGQFSGGMQLTQASPGVTSGVLNTQAYMAAEGKYYFGTDEFFVSLVISGGPPGSGLNPALEWGLLSNASQGNTGGWFIRLGADGTGKGVLYGGFLAGGFNTSVTINEPVLAKNYIAMSRKNLDTPGFDKLSLFWNGTLVQSAVVATGAAGGIETLRNDLLIGCRVDSGGTNAGFQGMIDEVFINHGPGTGIGASFTPPTQPYTDTNYLPPFV